MNDDDFLHPFWAEFQIYMRGKYGNLSKEFFYSAQRCGKEWEAFKAGIEAREDSIGDTLGEDQ